MERKEFLLMAQKASRYDKKKVPEECLVAYNGTAYIPSAYVLHFDGGNPVHSVVLLDRNANSITQVSLAKVDKFDKSENG